jgi:16S rRNA (guanine527-N7)-methyltransferase
VSKTRDIFVEFLKKKFNGEELNQITQKFDVYFSQLVEINSKINLFSRQTNIDDLWTIHFLDSLLILDVIDLGNKTICDFGTGGGLPGIPLAIIYPNSEIFLLDSKQKKLSAIEKMLDEIGIKNCKTIHTRIENIEKKFDNFFDVLTCRSVKILPEFVNPIRKIMKKNGKIFIYKSIILDDLNLFESKKFYDVGRSEIGKRIIAEINPDSKYPN